MPTPMPLPKNDESLPISRYPTPVVGRLVAMPTTAGNMDVAALRRLSGLRTGVVAFDFPSMPDVIELARSADYYTNYSPVMPDGMHQYRGTKPMEIPLSFKLHAMDRTFCPYGALTLLQLAARLHSFVLPISPNGGTGYQVSPVIAREVINQQLTDPDKKKADIAALGLQSEDQQLYDTTLNTPVYSLSNATTGKVGFPYPPVTCLLNLIWVSADQPGISCIGYVREVRVRLMGPWLRGGNGEYNLPTSGEFEFVFIHRPSHNNNAGLDFSRQTGQFNSAPPMTESQAYATDVRNQLYNTRNLVKAANYRGFDSPGNGGTTLPDAVSVPSSTGYQPLAQPQPMQPDSFSPVYTPID